MGKGKKASNRRKDNVDITNMVRNKKHESSSEEESHRDLTIEE